jgi:hypothetical protein
LALSLWEEIAVAEGIDWSKVELVTVYKVQGHLLAEVLKAKLESEGIPALLRYESVGRVLGLTVDGLGQVEIQVPVEMEEQARAVLSEAEPLDSTSGEPPAKEP